MTNCGGGGLKKVRFCFFEKLWVFLGFFHQNVSMITVFVSAEIIQGILYAVSFNVISLLRMNCYHPSIKGG